MKLIGRILIICLLLTVATPVFAESVQVIQFSKALELTFANNLDLKIAELTLANSQIDLEKSQLASNADTRSQQLNLALDLAKSKDSYRTTRYNMIISLITDFSELTKKRQTIEVNENLLKIKESDLKLTSDLYVKGSATSTDLKNARNAVADQKLALEKSKEDYANLVADLKSKTGLTYEVKFNELTLTINQQKFDVTKAIEQAAAVSYDLKDKDIRNQLAMLEVEKGQLEKRPELELKKLTNNQQIALYRYQIAKDDLNKKVKDQITLLEQTLKTLEIKKVEAEIAKESYQQTQAGYEKGHYTQTQLLQSKNTWLNAEKGLFTVRVDYIIKLTAIQHMIGNDTAIGGDIK